MSLRFLDKQTRSTILPNKPSECAFGSVASSRNNVCSLQEDIDKMKTVISNPNKRTTIQTAEDVIEALKEQEQCDSESCLYTCKKVQQALGGKKKAMDIANEQFKPVGPYNQPIPLNEDHIRNLLKQWETLFPIFQSIEFQMIDFEEHNTQLRNYNFLHQLATTNKRCFAVYINTDVTGGSGKHWFCFFLDFRLLTEQEIAVIRDIVIYKTRDPSEFSNIRTTKRCTLEYFNSSGRSLYIEMQNWCKRTVNRIRETVPFLNLWLVAAARERHQFSNTECGVYAANYIFERLHNRPYTYYLLHQITDEMMLRLRQHLFRHS